MYDEKDRLFATTLLYEVKDLGFIDDISVFSPEDVLASLAFLSDKYRRRLTSYFKRRMTLEEIATIDDVTKSAIRWSIKSGLKALSKELNSRLIYNSIEKYGDITLDALSLPKQLKRKLASEGYLELLQISGLRYMRFPSNLISLTQHEKRTITKFCEDFVKEREIDFG